MSEVKARLSQIAEEVARTHERVHATRNGRDYVVLMSAQDLESLEATLELLADRREAAGFAEGLADLERGDTVSGTEMGALMQERREREPTGG